LNHWQTASLVRQATRGAKDRLGILYFLAGKDVDGAIWSLPCDFYVVGGEPPKAELANVRRLKADAAGVTLPPCTDFDLVLTADPPAFAAAAQLSFMTQLPLAYLFSGPPKTPRWVVPELVSRATLNVATTVEVAEAWQLGMGGLPPYAVCPLTAQELLHRTLRKAADTIAY
jgi:hypothetical protein